MTPASSSPSLSTPAPRVSSPEDLASLRSDLATLGDLGEELGEVASVALAREQRLPGLTAARLSDSREAVFARLFLLGDAVSADEADHLFAQLTLAGALRMGVVAPAGAAPDNNSYRATISLKPVPTDDDVRWLAADLGESMTGRPVNADHVLGVGRASLTLAGLTDRRPVSRALDLGTGCGIQAAFLADHAESIVATDISARALDFARFNAALNGQEWDVRGGSLFGPVAGERFDLIVSNPPFVITPSSVHDAGLPVMEYREAGAAGDDLLAQILRELPGHLSDDGRAVMLANWEHREDSNWQDRVAAMAGPNLDLWVIEREHLDPAEYVEMWLRDGGLTYASSGREAYERVYAAWLADFAERGVTGVGFGYVFAGPAANRAPIRRLEAVAGPAAPQPGAHLAASFDAQRELAAATADNASALASWRVAAAPDLTVEHHFIPGESEPTVIILRQGGGLGRTHRAGTALAGLISVADGELSIGQISAALAELLAVDPDELQSELLDDVAELVAIGMLTRVG